MDECGYMLTRKKKWEFYLITTYLITTFDGKKRNGNHYMHMYDKKNYNSGSVLLIF